MGPNDCISLFAIFQYHLISLYNLSLLHVSVVFFAIGPTPFVAFAILRPFVTFAILSLHLLDWNCVTVAISVRLLCYFYMLAYSYSVFFLWFRSVVSMKREEEIYQFHPPKLCLHHYVALFHFVFLPQSRLLFYFVFVCDLSYDRYRLS